MLLPRPLSFRLKRLTGLVALPWEWLLSVVGGENNVFLRFLNELLPLLRFNSSQNCASSNRNSLNPLIFCIDSCRTSMAHLATAISGVLLTSPAGLLLSKLGHSEWPCIIIIDRSFGTSRNTQLNQTVVFTCGAGLGFRTRLGSLFGGQLRLGRDESFQTS